MREAKTETKEVTEIKTIIVSKTVTCNRCGLTMEPKSYEDMVNFQLRFGYESRHDGESWDFDLCEYCLDDIVKTFKYVPNGFNEDSCFGLNPEQHRKAFEHWKETGEWEDLIGFTYEELKAVNGYLNTDYINEIIKRNFPEMPLLDEFDEDGIL